MDKSIVIRTVYALTLPVNQHWRNYDRDRARTIEPMGAVPVTCEGYINMLVDQVEARFHLAASRVVLCGHQHGACAALSAAMMHRSDPFTLTILLDPCPWEAYYLQHEQNLPPTRVVCIDNLWAKAKRGRGRAVQDIPDIWYPCRRGHLTRGTGQTR